MLKDDEAIARTTATARWTLTVLDGPSHTPSRPSAGRERKHVVRRFRRGTHRSGPIPVVTEEQFAELASAHTSVDAVLLEARVVQDMGASLAGGIAAVRREHSAAAVAEGREHGENGEIDVAVVGVGCDGGVAGGVARLKSIVVLEAQPVAAQLSVCPNPPELLVAQQFLERCAGALASMTDAVLAADCNPSLAALGALDSALEDVYAAGHVAAECPEMRDAEEMRGNLAEWVARTDALHAARGPSVCGAVFDMQATDAAGNAGGLGFARPLQQKLEQLLEDAPRPDVAGVWGAIGADGIGCAASFSGQLEAVAGLLLVDRNCAASAAADAASARELALRLKPAELFVADIFPLMQSSPCLRSRAGVLVPHLADVVEAELRCTLIFTRWSSRDPHLVELQWGAETGREQGASDVKEDTSASTVGAGTCTPWVSKSATNSRCIQSAIRGGRLTARVVADWLDEGDGIAEAVEILQAIRMSKHTLGSVYR